MSRELVVLSHLRWTFVWQRPQHLISRLSTYFDRVFFVEEPLAVEGLTEPALVLEDVDHVSRVWLDLPAEWQCAGFDATASEGYARALGDVLAENTERMVWLYTPMGLDIARTLRPSLLVYDVMDDLAAFKCAPPALALRQRQALREADVVFCGGRSLHQSVIEHRPSGTHCFPSGVEPEHFARAITLRAGRPPGDRRVAGYVGVIDERIDLDLVRRLAGELADWEIRMVGPIAKIDPSTLPQAANITYPGSQPYAQLPQVMGHFDVALMPFALNEATRSISPTKTLEYLAAGLPVISTPVPDVVADYAGLVAIHEEADAIAGACRAACVESRHARKDAVAAVLQSQHWDAIAARMRALIGVAGGAATGPVEESA